MNNQTSEYPCHGVEVSYENKSAGITLSGTLTLPPTTSASNPFPVAILIPGMGPIDRDGTNYYGRKPSAVLANHLTKQGIAVLRSDKRGVGKSTGIFDLTVTCQDLADDVLASIAYLKTRKEIDPSRIGLIGHSEGALVATIVAANSSDIAFTILTAGALTNDIQNVVAQLARQLHNDGASADIIKQDSAIRSKILELIKQKNDAQQTENQVKSLFAEYWLALPEDQKKEAEAHPFAFSQTKLESQIKFMNSVYYRFMLKYDSLSALAHIQNPLLILYGELDFMAPEIVIPPIKMAMAKSKNNDYTILELPKLNHSLQTGITGSLAEYATIQETIAPLALQTISGWILKRVTKQMENNNREVANSDSK